MNSSRCPSDRGLSRDSVRNTMCRCRSNMNMGEGVAQRCDHCSHAIRQDQLRAFSLSDRQHGEMIISGALPPWRLLLSVAAGNQNLKNEKQ